MNSEKSGTTSLAPNRTALIERVRVTNKAVHVDFDDGRSIGLPLAWYPRLLHGSQAERNTYELIGSGEGVSWPLLDEDLSAEGFLAGRPSAEEQSSIERWLKGRRSSRR
jgi:hypothetical protein